MTKLKIGIKQRERLGMQTYSLRQLQAAYLKVTLRKEEGKEVCLYCWKDTHCNCGINKDQVKNDPFINLTFE